MVLDNCNTGNIATYQPSIENPWNSGKIKHLYRRLSYGATLAEIKAAQNMDPEVLVDQLIEQAINQGVTTAPVWSTWTDEDYNEPDDEKRQELKQEDMKEGYQLATKDLLKNGLHGRLTFFWLNHFVTQYSEYNCPSYMYQYYAVLQKYAIGNFKEFVREIGLTPAMLTFLNNFENTARRPNENYARELYELFTLGEDVGYTQEDIEETSRALTGYNTREDRCGTITFDSSTFDGSSKTIFGRTGNWGYDDVIEILFEERAELIAEFICAKLYRYFVSQEQNPDIIVQMKKTFLANNFEIAPVVRQLLKSNHFFNAATQGIVIKSPYDLILQFLTETGMEYDDELLEKFQYMTSTLGQNMFQPVDVAGWQRDRKWLNTNTLSGRWFYLIDVIWHIWNDGEGKEEYRKFAISLVEPNEKDADIVVRTIVDYLISRELVTITDYEVAKDIFKGVYPDNYYTDGIWNLQLDRVPDQVRLLLMHLIEMPEYQLK